MALTNKAEIIKFCNEINKKEGSGTIYTIDSEYANLKINRWSTGIEDLDVIIGGGMPEGRVIEIYGPEGCIDGDTTIRCTYGKKNTSMPIKELYRRFHKIPTGDNRKDRCLEYEGDFQIRSIDDSNGRVLSQKIADVVDSGTKECYEVITESGKKITCTMDHKFLNRPKQYLPLSELVVGDTVYVHNCTRVHSGEGRPKYKDVMVKYHPLAYKKRVTANGYKGKKRAYEYTWYQRAVHVVMYEAYINDYTYEEFIDVLNNESKEFIDQLWFVDLSKYDVHHIDFDSFNNSIENLQLLEKKEHNRLHAMAKIKNLSYVVTKDRISSVTHVGKRHTYDIKCYAPNNNYIANDFVVHNSGKTTLLYHLMSMHSICLDIPIEGTFDAERAKVFGNKPKQMLVYRAKYGEDAMNKTIRFGKAGIPLIGIDSVPSLIPKDDAEKVLKSAARDSIEEQRIGGTARLLTKYLPVIEEIIEVTGTTLIFTNQVRDKMQAMMFGEKTDTPGGRKLKHACSLRIAVARRAWIEIPNKNPSNSARTEKVGFIMKCKVQKSKVCNPLGECEIPCFFDRGFVSFDEVKEIRAELMAKNVKAYGKRSSKVDLDDYDYEGK